jgi:hypothetical protein
VERVLLRGSPGRNEVVVPEPQDNAAEIATGPLVGLFVTCLVDLSGRPSALPRSS